MNRNAQGLVLAAIGGVALRVGITDEYTRYVNEWMRWPLVLSGLLIVALAFTVVLRPRDDHGADEEPTTRAAWALLIPVLVAFVVQPVALGSYVAERRVNDVAAVSYDQASVASLADGQTHEMLVSEFVALAASYGEMLRDADVRLTGFVTSDDDGWYVTRLTMRCCAADAGAFRVRVDGPAVPAAPADEAWVQVTGTWVDGTGVDGVDMPALSATEVTEVPEPRQQYE